MTVENNKYEIARRKRQEHVDAILNSPSTKKIVVAGPGTGKTYLFKKILQGKANTLTLSFVNAPVPDPNEDALQFFRNRPVWNDAPSNATAVAYIFETIVTCDYDLAGDLDGNCKVDLSDLAIMASNWLIDCYFISQDPACIPKNS